MKRQTQKHHFKAAAALLCLCALGGAAIMKPAALFREHFALTAEAATTFTLNGCEFTVSGNTCTLTHENGASETLQYSAQSSFDRTGGPLAILVGGTSNGSTYTSLGNYNNSNDLCNNRGDRDNSYRAHHNGDSFCNNGF